MQYGSGMPVEEWRHGLQLSGIPGRYTLYLHFCSVLTVPMMMMMMMSSKELATKPCILNPKLLSISQSNLSEQHVCVVYKTKVGSPWLTRPRIRIAAITLLEEAIVLFEVSEV
ncbi:hypothetical protein V6N11_066993 [Hibiscus sabdariffa]|uniref:Uncharacterized protein n=1 Tax=Hibiscus sabdariffa TaxID=183260 RepID=A0ABR2SQA5_9ROSI